MCAQEQRCELIFDSMLQGGEDASEKEGEGEGGEDEGETETAGKDEL